MQRHEKDYRRREQQQQQPYRNREHEAREFGRDFDNYAESLDRRALETSRGEGGYQEGRGFYPRGFEGPREWDRGFEGRQRYEEEMYDDRRFPERNRVGMMYGPYGEPISENWRNRSFSQWEPLRGQQYGQGYAQQHGQPSYGQPWIGRYSGEGYLRPEDEFEDDYRQHFGRGMNRFQSQGQIYQGEGRRMWGNQYGGGFLSAYQMGQNSGKGPRGFTRSDDRIKEDISERLTDHPELDASDIEIKVHSGEVILTGTVNERWGKRVAEDLAESVSGVKQVQNQIRLQENLEQQGSQSSRQGPGTESGSKREHEAVAARR